MMRPPIPLPIAAIFACAAGETGAPLAKAASTSRSITRPAGPEPETCEISYTTIDYLMYACSGYWDDKLNWHEGHFWPQYFILMDLLELPNLKQPELKPEDYLFKSDVEKFKMTFLNKPKNKIN